MISLKSKQEVDLMRESANRLKAIFAQLEPLVQVGVTTLELNAKAEAFMRQQDVTPAFKGYHGFPAVICTSINEVVVHGIPSEEGRLKAGDVLSVDMGVIHEGYFSDSARTWPVGTITPDTQALVEVARGALFAGKAELKPGNRMGDVSSAIQTFIESRGYGVVRDFVGHGIGRALHEDPQVPNFGKAGKGVRLEAGMVLALEPMVVAGNYEVKVLDDKWTVVTKDKSLATHYEYTIAITEDGPINLTGPQDYIPAGGA